MVSMKNVSRIHLQGEEDGLGGVDRLSVISDTILLHLGEALGVESLVKSKVIFVGLLPLSEHGIVVDSVSNSPSETDEETPEHRPVETLHGL